MNVLAHRRPRRAVALLLALGLSAGQHDLLRVGLPILAGVIGEYMPDRDDHRGAEGVAAGIGGAKILGDMFK